MLHIYLLAPALTITKVSLLDSSRLPVSFNINKKGLQQPGWWVWDHIRNL
ncbi:hypothetical protein NC651_001696 [Populus alba x Populus x berolinensis]|nr:hypothetical protein NC651_001696 [Populus alba x Populus x berolinensis]